MVGSKNAKEPVITSKLKELCDYIILTYISNKNGGLTVRPRAATDVSSQSCSAEYP